MLGYWCGVETSTSKLIAILESSDKLCGDKLSRLTTYLVFWCRPTGRALCMSRVNSFAIGFTAASRLAGERRQWGLFHSGKVPVFISFPVDAWLWGC